MHPTRKFFLKFLVFALILALIQAAWSIALPWQTGLWILIAVLLTLTIVYPLGQPLYWLWQRYEDKTTEGMRFFQGAGVVLALVAFYRLYYVAVDRDVTVFERMIDGEFPPGDYAYWGIAGLTLFISGSIPPLAERLFAAWMGLAMMIQRVMSKVILTLIYILTVLPIGLIGKLVGKKFLVLKPEPDAATYWITREERPFEEKRYRRHF